MERKPVHREADASMTFGKFVNLVRDLRVAYDTGKQTSITITGQIRGGKNSVQTTKTGRRYPNKVWAKWRDAAVREVAAQIPKDWRAIIEPTNIRMEYWAGDKRRRDMPAIIDAAFHVLEKAGFTEDDTFLWVKESTRSYDKQNPRLTITIIS
jgi:Holliday junction resolvase RusA-like endonuclease